MAVTSSIFLRIECKAGQPGLDWLVLGIFHRFSAIGLFLHYFLHFPISHTKISLPSASSHPCSSTPQCWDGWGQDEVSHQGLCREDTQFWHCFGCGAALLSAAADAAPHLALHSQTEKGNHLCVPLLIPTELGNLPARRGVFLRGQSLERSDF